MKAVAKRAVRADGDGARARYARRAGHSANEPPQLLPDLQSPADVARPAVRPRDGCGTDCRWPRSLTGDANRYAAMLAYQEAAEQARPTALVPCPRLVPELPKNRTISGVTRPPTSAVWRLRKGRGDVPWLSGVKAAWGSELELINISSTGLLVETGSKFTPGSTTELHFSGPDTNLVVPVRFIRSDVARIDGLGVRYRAAAAFAREVDLAGPRRETGVPVTPPQELASLFGNVLVNSEDHRDAAHVRFAQGLRELVGARDVQVRTGSAGSAGGAETLYFDVPGEDRLRTTLQVTFERSRHVSSADFKLLKAAAWLTAAVLELEKPVAEELRLLTEKVA